MIQRISCAIIIALQHTRAMFALVLQTTMCYYYCYYYYYSYYIVIIAFNYVLSLLHCNIRVTAGDPRRVPTGDQDSAKGGAVETGCSDLYDMTC